MNTIQNIKRRLSIPWWVFLAISLLILFLVRNAFADPLGGQNIKVLAVLGSMVLASLLGIVQQAVGRSTTVPALMLVGGCGLYVLLSITYMASKGVVVADVIGMLFAVVLIAMITAITTWRKTVARRPS